MSATSSDPMRSCGLDPRKARALDLRMMGWSWQKIADTLTEEGATVSHETVRRWSLSEEWGEEYNARRGEIERASLGAQVGLVELAWDGTRKVLTDDLASNTDRLRAAELVLKHLGPAVKSEVAVNGGLGEHSEEELKAIIVAALASQG